MIVDLYTREPNDPLYVPGVLETKNELDVLVGQIRMLLFTKPGDVIGRINFGIDIESQVFLMNVSTLKLEEEIRNQIYANCTLAEFFDVKVNVSFFYGTTRDICLIDIIINGTKYLGLLLK
jgi:hypothetical protein